MTRSDTSYYEALDALYADRKPAIQSLSPARLIAPDAEIEKAKEKAPLLTAPDPERDAVLAKIKEAERPSVRKVVRAICNAVRS